jgi:hypothetical protein
MTMSSRSLAARRPLMLAMVLLGLTVANAAAAFDGQRQGFVLSVGAGVCPRASLSGTDRDGTDLSETANGWGMAVAAGFGLTERDVFALRVDGAFIPSKLYGDTSHQAFTGVTWTRTLGEPGRAFYAMVGAGRYDYDWQGSRSYICWGNDCDPPPALPGDTGRTGWLVGFGRELEPHWRFGVTLMLGRPAYDGDFTFSHGLIMLQHDWF